MPFSDDPVWIDGLTYSGAEMRRAEAMTLMADGTAGGARGGVRPGDPGLTTSLVGSTITVTPGVAAVSYSGQGLYRAVSPSAWTGTLSGADPTNPRIDLVYLRVWDTAVDASGSAQADMVYLAGTPAASPVVPTPAGTQIYIPLAQISVPAAGGGAASVDTSVRPTTVGAGGIGVGTGMAGVHAGQYRDTGGTSGTLQRYTGAAWEDRVAVASGGKLAVGSAELSRSSGGAVSANTNYQAARSATTDAAYTALLSGDPFSRFSVTADGKQEWGPGNAARDTNLYRSAANTLTTDDDLYAANLTGGAWASFTPTWTADSGTTTVGTGTLVGLYCRLGKAIHFQIRFQWGSTTTQQTAGSNWSFALPTAVSNVNGGTMYACTAWILDSSANTRYIAGAYCDSSVGKVTAITVHGSAAGFVDNQEPMVWASGDRLNIWGTYEMA